MQKQETPTLSRRSFLAAAVCVPALAIGAVLTRGAAPAPTVALPDDEAPRAGYHETEHIRSYYRSAAF